MDNKRDNKKLILTIFFVVIPLFIGCISYMLYNILPTPNVIQTEESPNGEYVAYVFESNGGATTGFTYRLSILKCNKKLGKSKGNVYIYKNQFNIQWEDDNTLKVYNSSTINIFKQKVRINGISVKYKYLKRAGLEHAPIPVKCAWGM